MILLVARYVSGYMYTYIHAEADHQGSQAQWFYVYVHVIDEYRIIGQAQVARGHDALSRIWHTTVLLCIARGSPRNC